MSEKPLKLRRPYQEGTGRDHLDRFVSDKDRNLPPIFVGREEILESIRKDVESCRENSNRQASYTSVIQGAPGAGKTSLLAEIEKQVTRGGRGWFDRKATVVVNMTGGELSNDASVANRFIKIYNKEPPNFRTEETTSAKVKGDALVLGGEASSATREKALEQQIQSAGGVWEVIAEQTQVNKAKTVFIFLIDEAQNIESGDSSIEAKNKIAMSLHEGFQSTAGIKIVPIFAGLSNTASVLRSNGVSRLRVGDPTLLESLTQDESKELVSSWMQYDGFEFDNLFTHSDIARVSSMIAVASEGWPRHAYSYLRGIGQAVLEQQDKNNSEINLDEVFERGHAERFSYYRSRVASADLEEYASTISDAAKESTNGVVTRKQLFDLAENKHRIPVDEYRQSHRDAIQAGILELVSADDETKLFFPIPSLFTYMQCDRDEQEFKKRMREQMDANSHLWSEPKGLTR